MASKCYTCNGSISNSDFITCAGVCQQLFHIKCVAVNKSMLNAVTTCANIHWFCHECNSGNRNFSASIDRINESIGLLTKSLSGDLIQFVNGFKSLTENFMETISTTTVSNATIFIPPSSTACRGDEIVRTPENYPKLVNQEQSTCGATDEMKSVEKSRFTSSATANDDRERYRSVVVSNIGKDITTDYLTNYLADKLRVAKEKISASILLPAGKSINDLIFFQYKITIPEDKYRAIMCSKSWPSNVYVRDFVYKRKIDGVPMEMFLIK